MSPNPTSPNHALQRTAPRVTVAAILAWTRLVRSWRCPTSVASLCAPPSQLPRHAPPSLSLGSLGVATSPVKTVILAFLFFTASLLAEPKLPASVSIAGFTADAAAPETSEHFKNFRIERADFAKVLDTYFTVTRDDWMHAYSHVAFGDRTGTATLKDGTVLKWLVRPGGLATVTFPDGTIIYLATSKTK